MSVMNLQLRCEERYIGSMQIEVPQAVVQTVFFVLGLLAFILITFRYRPLRVLDRVGTNEIKGYAMLAVIFAHAGYFLTRNTEFLFPLSMFGGIAVNVFYLFSGYGLALSADKDPMEPTPFYKKRFAKILIPLVISLAVWYVADNFILHRSYPLSSVIFSMFGVFRSSDIFNAVNSPLWYLTPLFGFYLLFPISYHKDHPYRSAFFLFSVGYLVMKLFPYSDSGISHLYGTHYIAFPLGVLIAGYMKRKGDAVDRFVNRFRIPIFVCMGALFSYLSFHAAIGSEFEQLISLIAVLAGGLAFYSFPFGSELIQKFGTYSYEMYLVHWPLMYRYGYVFRFLPAWLGLLTSIALIYVLARVLHKATSSVSGLITKAG